MFDHHSKDTLDKLERLESLCQLYYHIDSDPILYLIWYRQWDTLKMFFFLDRSDPKLRSSGTALFKHSAIHYLSRCEQLLAHAFDLRIFVLQHREWIQHIFQKAEPDHRELMITVINTITDFIQDFIAIVKLDLEFWTPLFTVHLEDFPYVMMYTNIAIR